MCRPCNVLMHNSTDPGIFRAIDLLDIVTQPFIDGLEAYTGLKFALIGGWPPCKNSSKLKCLCKCFSHYT
jgi:hypothetical protein